MRLKLVTIPTKNEENKNVTHTSEYVRLMLNWIVHLYWAFLLITVYKAKKKPIYSN